MVLMILFTGLLLPCNTDTETQTQRMDLQTQVRTGEDKTNGERSMETYTLPYEIDS